MRVRTATALDEAGVLDVLRSDGENRGRQPSKAALQKARNTVRSSRALTLLAEADGAVLGFLVAELSREEPGVLQLSQLCVRPEDRRRGVGRALLDALLERFPQVSCWVCDGAPRTVLEQAGLHATGRTDGDRSELRSGLTAEA